MRALVCETLGPAANLRLRDDWPLPVPGPDEVRVAVRAASLNFPDTLIIQGAYQTKPELPFVPGSECAGVVDAVGSAVRDFKAGDEVIAIPTYGAFTEYLVTAAANVYRKPAGLDMAAAAAFGITYFTTYHAFRQRAQLRAGETLLVLGAGGGVGSAAVELGKLMGAHVIAAASTPEKLQLAGSKGADVLINYRERPLKEALREATGGRGVDVVYDPVGGAHSEIALRGMAWNGRYLVIGFADGEIPRLPLNLPLLKGCAVVGVFWGRFAQEEPALSRRNVEELAALVAGGHLQPAISRTFPLDAYVAAFDSLTGRQALGKVVLLP
jgi:NADPH2:quinone reductase